MKKIMMFTLLAFATIIPGYANDVKLFYSETCPHCHYAREFFATEVKPNHKGLRVTEYNLSDQKNIQSFREALAKCKYENGYVPVIVVGDKCFQGYSKTSNPELIAAVEVVLKNKPAETEEVRGKPLAPAEEVKKDNGMMPYYALLGVLILGLGFVLLRKKK